MDNDDDGRARTQSLLDKLQVLAGGGNLGDDMAPEPASVPPVEKRGRKVYYKIGKETHFFIDENASEEDDAPSEGVVVSEECPEDIETLQPSGAEGNDGATSLVSSNSSSSQQELATTSKEVNGLETSLSAMMRSHTKSRESELKVWREKEAENQQREQRVGKKGSGRRKQVPAHIIKQMKSLPIYKYKKQIVETIKANQFVLIMGDTGSGKSTQIPQFLYEAGFATKGKKIGITQPRRVAAKSLADRVSLELGVNLGNEVGYAVRFEKFISRRTMLKYMTDGMLVKEFAQDPNLEAYSVIMIDEAHERSIHTDVCFGLLKRAAKKRPDLKVIISSATLEEEKFSSFFNGAPTLRIEGQSHEVDIQYEPYPEKGCLQGVVNVILKIHTTGKKGDILAFLSGEDEIDEVTKQLKDDMADRKISEEDLLILPCFGALPLEEQQKIFDDTPNGKRKVVLATNIAETSITIDGIVYVVDAGYYKQNEYNSTTGISSLVRRRLTKFQAIQRKGRAGRTCSGICYRLYSQQEFDTLQEAPMPDIQRSNIDSVMLDLVFMGITAPLPPAFEYMDQPPTELMCEAIEHLVELSAFDENFQITAEGKLMAILPLDPPQAKVVLESARLGCSEEVLKIVAMLNIPYKSLFRRMTKEFYGHVEKVRAKFRAEEGDHLTLLKLYDEWKQEKTKGKWEWCAKNFMQQRYFEEADDILWQLRGLLKSQKMPLTLCGQNKDVILRAFTTGYFRNFAKKLPSGKEYRSLSINPTEEGSEKVVLHPSSALSSLQSRPKWIIYHEVITTTQSFVRGASSIKPEWILEFAPQFVEKLKEKYGDDVLA